MRVTASLSSAFLVLALTGMVEGQGAGKRAPDKTPPPKSSSKTPSESSSYSPPSEIGGKTLAKWKAQLKHPDPSRRAEAILVLPHFGEASASCVAPLLDRLEDKDTSPRVKAVMAFRLIHVHRDDGPRVVRGLTKRITWPEETQAVVRYEALRTLSQFADDVHTAIPSLVRATKDTNSWEIRHAAVKVLAQAGWSKSGADDRAVVALLAVMNTDPAFHVRLEATQCLGTMGQPSEKMSLPLRNALWKQYTATTNSSLRLWTLATLVAIDGGTSDKKSADQALKKLGSYLTSKDKEARINAAQALGALGKRAKPQVPALLKMTTSLDPVFVQAACGALGSIGDDSPRVIDAMLELLGHADPGCVVASCGALLQLNATGARVLTALQRRLDRADLKDETRPFLRYTIDQLKKPAKSR
jgi:HEAT repeat protein